MINYVTGDATDLEQEGGKKLLLHIVNTENGWGKGFVKAISARWKAPELAYRQWAAGKCEPEFVLGNIQIVGVKLNLAVVNMLAQEGYLRNGNIPIRYDALERCLSSLRVYDDRSFHMPRIGCELAGGTWDKIEPIIQRTIGHLPVTVYDFEVK